jgi:hypothetical protein
MSTAVLDTSILGNSEKLDIRSSCKKYEIYDRSSNSTLGGTLSSLSLTTLALVRWNYHCTEKK